MMPAAVIITFFIIVLFKLLLNSAAKLRFMALLTKQKQITRLVKVGFS